MLHFLFTEHSTNGECAECAKAIRVEDALYDENTEKHFCNDDCFQEWANNHVESVIDYYIKMNVG